MIFLKFSVDPIEQIEISKNQKLINTVSYKTLNLIFIFEQKINLNND